MERPLTPVPIPTMKDSTDIRVYVEVESEPSVAACMFYFLTVLTLTNTCAVCTSLHGTRSVKEFLALLKEIIVPNDFHLETLKDRRVVDIRGAIGPGEYIASAFISAYWRCVLLIISIFSLQPVGPSLIYGIVPLLTFRAEVTMLKGASADKKRKLSTTEVSEGVRSQRVLRPNLDSSAPF